MGKNRVRESLIKQIANTVVHEVLRLNTRKKESGKFIESEIIEYRGQSGKAYLEYNWNKEDLIYIKAKALKKIKEKLDSKYPDISYKAEDAERFLKEEINDLIQKNK